MLRTLLLIVFAAPLIFVGQVDGCTSSHACNYAADATDDDGSCVFVDGDVLDILNTDFEYIFSCFGQSFTTYVTLPAVNSGVIDGYVVDEYPWSLCDETLYLNGLVFEWDGNSFWYEEDDCWGDFIPSESNSIEHIEGVTERLVKIVDISGREVSPEKLPDSSRMLFYIYESGLVTKSMRIR